MVPWVGKVAVLGLQLYGTKDSMEGVFTWIVCEHLLTDVSRSTTFGGSHNSQTMCLS